MRLRKRDETGFSIGAKERVFRDDRKPPAFLLECRFGWSEISLNILFGQVNQDQDAYYSPNGYIK
jgi:hypothetical protein